jgi:ditrans,polycis-polyprenyl diphosphate synthase
MFRWLTDYVSTKSQNVLLDILASGPIPKHIGFIMDGNRRYARRNGKEIAQGHADGFTNLRKVRSLLVCGQE